MSALPEGLLSYNTACGEAYPCLQPHYGRTNTADAEIDLQQSRIYGLLIRVLTQVVAIFAHSRRKCFLGPGARAPAKDTRLPYEYKPQYIEQRLL